MAKCDGTQLPLECVRRFEAGTAAMTEAAAAIGTIGQKVDDMHMVLTGDGKPEDGLSFRVTQLETDAKDAGKTRRRWKDRLWQIAQGVILLAAGAIIMACAGCALAKPANQAVITPVSTTEAPVTAEHIEKLDQKISQVQNTLSVQTTNYALDSERRKLESDRLANQLALAKDTTRKVERERQQERAIGLGLLVLFAVAPTFLPKRWMWLGYVVGLGILVAAIGLPFLWPW